MQDSGIKVAGSSLDRDLFHHHRFDRSVSGACLGRSYFLDHIQAFDDFAENRVPVVQVRRWCKGDEKLAAVGAGAGIGHR